MNGRRIVLTISALLIVGGLVCWLATGAPGFRLAALVGILGLAITFIFSGGPRQIYGPVPESVRNGGESRPAL